jgi:predicted transcriptional regulator
MEIIYACGKATAAQVRARMADPPSYSAVRALLRILEGKGALTHTESGQQYVYVPTMPPANARRAALKHVIRTFFEGSVEDVVATLLDVSKAKLSDADFDRLSALVEHAKREGR